MLYAYNETSFMPTEYTRNRWKNGKRKSKNFASLMLQMRKSMLFYSMLRFYFTVFIMTPEGRYSYYINLTPYITFIYSF